jgi:6-pyruvoyl-tetrahydropterin synthase
MTSGGPLRRAELCIERSLEFQAAHQLPSSCETPECERIHGHAYRLSASWRLRFAAGEQPLNDEGMICNFIRFKRLLAKVHELFDHQFINLVALPRLQALGQWSFAAGMDKAPAELSAGEAEMRPSTAENLVIWIFHYLQELSASGEEGLSLPPGLELCELRLWETAKNCVTFRQVD